MCVIPAGERDRRHPAATPSAPEGPGCGAEHQAERRNLQRRPERPEQLPLPAAGPPLHTQGMFSSV